MATLLLVSGHPLLIFIWVKIFKAIFEYVSFFFFNIRYDFSNELLIMQNMGTHTK